MEPLIDKSKIRPSRWWYVLAAVLFVLGCVGFAVQLYGSLKNTETKMSRLVTPGEITVDLEKTGRYTLYYEHSSRVDGKIYNTNPFFEGLHCIVTSAETRQIVPLKAPSMNITYQYFDFQGRAIYTFKIDHPGKYAMMCSVDSRGGNDSVVVALASNRDVNISRVLLISFAAIFSGGLVGTVITVTVAVLRNRSFNRLRSQAAGGIHTGP